MIRKKNSRKNKIYPIAKLYIQTSHIEFCCCPHLVKTPLSFQNKTMKLETKYLKIERNRNRVTDYRVKNVKNEEFHS